MSAVMTSEATVESLMEYFMIASSSESHHRLMVVMIDPQITR
jgi:hypothetical protein